MDLEDSYYITKLKITEPQPFNLSLAGTVYYITKLKITKPQHYASFLHLPYTQ